MIHRIPLAALAAMLIFTGVRLASPREFAKTWKIGREQLFVFVTTILVTITTDLLVGVAAGIVVKMIIHLVNGASLKGLFQPEIQEEIVGETIVLRIKHAAVFTNYLSIKRWLNRHTEAKHVVVDFEQAFLIDHTVMEKLHELQEEHKREGRHWEFVGLHDHTKLSEHPLAARKKIKGRLVEAE